jgi:intracellular sulfur oxidation DsrE/DsrF family protein
MPSVLGSIKNSMNGLQFGFAYPARAIAVALAGHGPSAVYAFRDSIWQKYRIGEFFKLTDTGVPVTSNRYFAARSAFDEAADPDDDNGMYQDASVATLQRRGLIVLTCHTAVEEIARGLVRGGFAPAGMDAAAVAGDILTNLIDGAVVVPSMVATIAVLQSTYRYGYLTPA